MGKESCQIDHPRVALVFAYERLSQRKGGVPEGYARREAPRDYETRISFAVINAHDSFGKIRGLFDNFHERPSLQVPYLYGPIQTASEKSFETTSLSQQK